MSLSPLPVADPAPLGPRKPQHMFVGWVNEWLLLLGPRRKGHACSPCSLALKAGRNLSQSLRCPQQCEECGLQGSFLRESEELPQGLVLMWTLRTTKGEDCSPQPIFSNTCFSAGLCPKLDKPKSSREAQGAAILHLGE